MATTAGGSSAGGEQPTEQVAVAAANDAPAPPPAAPPAIQQAPAPVNLTTTQVDENVIEAEIVSLLTLMDANDWRLLS